MQGGKKNRDCRIPGHSFHAEKKQKGGGVISARPDIGGKKEIGVKEK